MHSPRCTGAPKPLPDLNLRQRYHRRLSTTASPRRAGTSRILVLLASTTVALASALAFILWRGPVTDPRVLQELALESADVRALALRELVERADGVWDSFSDPDVGRVLQRNVSDRDFRGVPVSSNEFGMREHSFELPKPPGITRIALLGDSFVFGYKVAAEDRLGVFLERFLEERTPGPPRVECLHLSISSWNILAECAYLRRQLHLLRPDLVVQVIVVNDLDDLQGVRGFGAMGSFSPQFRKRANGTFTMMSPADLWPRRVPNFLLDGLDHTSRERYEEAADAIERLASAVEDTGGSYLLVIAWDSYNPMAKKYFAARLRDEQVAFVSRTFTADLRFRIDASDRHWNRAGHERMAQLIYGLVVERGLLSPAKPAPWDVAAQVVREVHLPGLGEAGHVDRYEAALRARAEAQIASSVDLTRLKQRAAKQVYGGIDAAGHVAPYATLILANRKAGTLRVRGRRFPAGPLQGAQTRVFLDEFEVGVLALSGPEIFDERWEVPQDLALRPYVSVRFESSDYALVDVAKGSCAAFIVERIALE